VLPVFSRSNADKVFPANVSLETMGTFSYISNLILIEKGVSQLIESSVLDAGVYSNAMRGYMIKLMLSCEFSESD
jgi:hypothetical protein